MLYRRVFIMFPAAVANLASALRWKSLDLAEMITRGLQGVGEGTRTNELT